MIKKVKKFLIQQLDEFSSLNKWPARFFAILPKRTNRFFFDAKMFWLSIKKNLLLNF